MRIHEIVEAQEWERFKGSIANRVWFDAHTGRAITTNDDGNHSIGVTNNKELFGVNDQELAQFGVQPGESAGDYDGRVLLAAMQKGWVRIYIDARSPDMNSNAEGTSFPWLRRAVIWYCEQVGTPRRFVLVIRHGIGDKEGTAHVLRDMDEIEMFIRKGSLPRVQEQPTQVVPANTTPHAFRKF